MTVWFDNITQNSNVLDFDVVGVDTSVANAIRRSILTNIPNVGFVMNQKRNVQSPLKRIRQHYMMSLFHTESVYYLFEGMHSIKQFQLKIIHLS